MIFSRILNPFCNNKYGLSFVAFLSKIKPLFKAFGGPEKGHLNFFYKVIILGGAHSQKGLWMGYPHWWWVPHGLVVVLVVFVGHTQMVVVLRGPDGVGPPHRCCPWCPWVVWPPPSSLWPRPWTWPGYTGVACPQREVWSPGCPGGWLDLGLEGRHRRGRTSWQQTVGCRQPDQWRWKLGCTSW